MPEREFIARGKRFSACILATSLLAACSQIAGSINPAEWYNGSIDFFMIGIRNRKIVKTRRVSRLMEIGLEVLSLKTGVSFRQEQQVKSFPTIASVDQQQDYYEARKRGALVADMEGRKMPALARQGESARRLALVPPSEPKTNDFQEKPNIRVVKPKNPVQTSNLEKASVF